MPQCSFKNCFNSHRNSKTSEGISFFRFPSDPFCCAEWISVVAKERREEFFYPSKNTYICSIHFDKFDITGNAQRRRLLKTAVPKFQIHGPIVQPATHLKLTTNSSNQAISTDICYIPQADAVSLSSDASLSDLISIRVSCKFHEDLTISSEMKCGIAHRVAANQLWSV